MQIAKFNDFSEKKIHILNHIIKNKIQFRKITALRKENEQPKQYHKMTYYGLISDKIKKIFSKI